MDEETIKRMLEDGPTTPEGLRLVLGDIVLAAGRLEDLAYDIAGLLRVYDPARLSSTAALGKIEALAPEGLPPWTNPRLTPKAVSAWARKTRRVVEERNGLFHATLAYSIGDDMTWVIERRSLRDGKPVTSDLQELNELLDEMHALSGLGGGMEYMLAMPAPGGGAVPPPYVKHRMAPLAGKYRWGPLPKSWWEWIDGAATGPGAP